MSVSNHYSPKDSLLPDFCYSPPLSFKQMNSSDHSYGSGYSNLIKAFTANEIKELLFGSALPSFSETFSDPSNPPQSAPGLAPLSLAPSVSSDTESVPEVALAFYAFIEGKFDP
ncbi:hypothetical protein O181_123385 [Austropuccinia psidii MF-1]|uniref:Uncharacterized protein n=1 Tax=Austropuccinia psidii MF-1 TaxID=1389203 RepID=A0A9Q3Q456_9BASI|nr:hypothetical protein [Austropuccinia psidii MF-1]